MLQNIESSQGLVMAEPLMMKLTEKGVGRQDAHEIIRESSMIAVEKNMHLRDVLLQREDLKGVLTPEEIAATMDASNYVGGSREIVDKMVSAAEEATGRTVLRWTPEPCTD
jgi:adenylosuccinate lyase